MPSLGFAVDLHGDSGTFVAGIDLHRFFLNRHARNRKRPVTVLCSFNTRPNIEGNKPEPESQLGLDDASEP